ncbi:MAG: double-strand break repair helicase AddA [Pseudomonadota bacterium]|nr:double-strand break repair helicase AddA [Pseudomonadota bacterium]
MASFDIPADTRSKQHQASNPNQSVWVSANAGSGKTHVLASRVTRFLLQGVAPSRILCLTFTKAAAANMAARVFDTLALWTQLSGDELCAQIVATGAPMPGSEQLTAARKLFARTVETPGGLKIQTIHAFCERLLHLFPFEANVPSRFEVPDDLRQAELLRRARREVLAEANSGKGALGAALQRVLDECGAEAFEDLIKETMGYNAISRARWPQEPAEVLRRSLGLTEGRDVACIEHEMAEEGIAPERWSVIAAILDHGKKPDQDRARRFRQAFSAYRSAPSDGSLETCLDSYLAIFFTTEGAPRVSLVTNDVTRAHPEIEAELRPEQLRLDALRAERKAAATLDRTRALIEVASAIFERYREEKAARGILDFDDLIEKTLALLERSDARWVLYKLDAGIDHVLVDEAQDTSEAQWKILEELTGDFAAGRGQSSGPRTFFAVGDEKQSIFSFQGAAPHMFDKMRRKFEAQFTAGAQPFVHVPLTLSFRSTPGVLSAIDKVFEHGDNRGGLVAANDVWRLHQALKHQLPGLVELWPLAAAQSNESPREWTLPLDLLDAQDPANLVAQRIAKKIKHLIDPGSDEFVHDSRTLRPRPVRPGDILILVRTRGPFFEAMIRALKKSQIRTAGADRLELTHHIAVMDLMAAGRASLLPQDDLALACVLKSPLIGLDDDDLMALALGRAASLFDALQASADAKHVEAVAKLARWRARAGGSPFDFYAVLLGADGGRRDIEARLGPETGDAIDELLRFAIVHEDARAPSLAAFLNDLAGLEYSIKRDMEGAEDAVRVMTIHAAKGLEAKIVFLPDTCGVPSPRHDPRVFALETKMPGERTIGWSPRKDLDCEAIVAARGKARDAARDEYRRLFYVALTRAEERLYIAGFYGVKGLDPGCWAKMIEAALANEAGIQTVPAFWNGEDQILRLISEGSGGPAAAALSDGLRPSAPAVLPDWLWRGAGFETNAMPPVRPSHALAPAHRLHGTGAAQAKREASRRGGLMHLLLQYLPGIATLHRRDAALAFLAARAAGLDDMVRQNLAWEVLKVIALPELASLFGQDSKAEVSVAGRIAAGRRMIEVNGKIDRIGEDQTGILAADYKTGAPCRLDSTPAEYIAQMALYRAVLAPLWPDKTLRMLLIWTAGPRVVWLPAGMLDAALAALAAG